MPNLNLTSSLASVRLTLIGLVIGILTPAFISAQPSYNAMNDATYNPNSPPNLGAIPNSTQPSAVFPNNTDAPATATPPSLANPFYTSLITPQDDNTLKNAIPLGIQKLLKAKKRNEALTEIDAFLLKNPKNVQLRFIRSRIYIEQGKLNEAMAELIDISEKFPELPEPYNNLAVLYAVTGKLEQARESLEMSLRLAPDNATVLQNLGDVYSRLAASKYRKAYQLNPRLRDSERKAKLAEAITASQTK